MLPINNEDLQNVRNPGRPDREAGLARPMRTRHPIFEGWGPKLFAVAIALCGILATHTSASADVKAVAITNCAANHGAVLISHPDLILLDLVPSAYGETTLRVGLGASGHVDNLAIAQSSGDEMLDFAAMRLARASRYEAASVNCEPAADEFLYKVTFSE
ncbi:MAG: TonB family protein [Candidatus Cybelea sp.]|jgi:TonB family protein